MIKVGERFGNFLIQAEIGRGGMGTIYVAVDTMLNREVALKVIHPQYSDNEQLMERFKIEAMTQARMNHPNIALIFSFNHIDNDYAIAMEYVEGRSLKDLLQERGHLPPLEALDLLEQILEGLSYAHSRNVIHRDIKPANILVSRDNQVKLSDFGIAKIFGAHGLTKTGMLVGTPWYTSPEQIIGKDIDFRSDLYSLGITFYEMMTGRVPFDSETNSEFQIQKAHLETPPPRPSLFNPDISLKLEKFVLKALQKDVNKRHPSAREMLAELRQLRRELAAATGLQTALEHPAPLRRGGRSRWLLPAGAALLAGLGLLGAWLNDRYHFLDPGPVNGAAAEMRETGQPAVSGQGTVPAKPATDATRSPSRPEASPAPDRQAAGQAATVGGSGEVATGRPGSLLVPESPNRKNPPLEPRRSAAPVTDKPAAVQTPAESPRTESAPPAVMPVPAEVAALAERLRDLMMQRRLADAEQLTDAYLQKSRGEQAAALLAPMGTVKFITGRFAAAEELWRRALDSQQWVVLHFFHIHGGPADRCTGQLRFRRGMLLFNSATNPDHSFMVRSAQFRNVLVKPRLSEMVLLADMNGQPLEWRLSPMIRIGRSSLESFLVDFLKKEVFK